MADSGWVVDAGRDGLLWGGEELVEGDGDLDGSVAVAGLDLDLNGLGLAGGEGQCSCEASEESGGGEKVGGSHDWLDGGFGDVGVVLRRGCVD